MSEFDKLPIPMIECEYCDYSFYYWADYIAHLDVKHPIEKHRIRVSPQQRIDNY